MSELITTVTELEGNLEQREKWARAGERWVLEAERYDAMNGPFGEAMLETARLRPGEKVLDVGCGGGATALQAAGRVAPGGSVVGVDFSAPMLGLARRRAALARFDNIEFLEADAQVHRFEEGTFDAVVSRFGTMFFGAPDVAFANLAHSLRPGGRLVIVCWQDVVVSEWTAVMGRAVADELGLPDIAAPSTPGPFAFGDSERLAAVVEAGGFREIELETLTRAIRLGVDADDALAFFASLELVRTWLTMHPPAKVLAALDAGRDALRAYAGPDGVVMNGTVWLLSARR